jgi:GTP 3',8-cyclase
LRYRYRDGGGELGLIASVTKPFCGACSRLRLSPEGQLYTCLFAVEGSDLRGPLRAGASDEEIAQIATGIWGRRTDRYSEIRSSVTTEPLHKVEMFHIGG